MAVISGSDYLSVTSEYDGAWIDAEQVKEYLFNAVYKIVLLQVILPEVDLLQEFWESYQVNAPVYGAPTHLLGAVRAMQSHVLLRGGYTTVDQYLVAEGIQVSSGWAELSDLAGYTISAANIA